MGWAETDSSFISISFNKPLLYWHNGTDIKRSRAGGWTRITGNSKQALSDEECTELQRKKKKKEKISAQLRIRWALVAAPRPAEPRRGLGWGCVTVSSLALCYAGWQKEPSLLGGHSSCLRCMVSLGTVHQVKWASTCFSSNGPRGGESILPASAEA